MLTILNIYDVMRESELSAQARARRQGGGGGGAGSLVPSPLHARARKGAGHETRVQGAGVHLFQPNNCMSFHRFLIA